MQFELTGLPQGITAERALLRAGYHLHTDPRSGTTSLARRLSAAGHYPRFHVYLDIRPGSPPRVNMHLDQKQPSYGSGTHAHAGEYEGPLLDGERDRILRLAPTLTESSVTIDEPKRGFFSRIFSGQ